MQNGEIWLYGTVGVGVSEDFEGFIATDVRDALAQIGPSDVTVRLNSPGGWCVDGIAIYNLLDQHKGKVSMLVEGAAVSAGSIIAMAGSEIVLRTGSFMMIHDCSGLTYGNAATHEKALEEFEVINAALASIYAKRTRRSVSEIRKEMRDETWMTASEAVQKRYADRVETGRAKQPMAAFANVYSHMPAQMAATATKARPSPGFLAAQARCESAKKAATNEAVTAFLREFCLGHEQDSAVASIVQRMKVEAPAAHALAMKLGPSVRVDRHPRRDDEISARHNATNGRDTGWVSAIAKANKLRGMN
ncbi:head maturation protease, ClpP-related [Mesorhizobium newzealandense]|uniref:ATP-dependent Clp protease proteolytic subunit n=1 Tax=Mesorhizobium newzealandense TaxID=1300302 RepID=A0ABW4UB30_9HYPH